MNFLGVASINSVDSTCRDSADMQKYITYVTAYCIPCVRWMLQKSRHSLCARCFQQHLRILELDSAEYVGHTRTHMHTHTHTHTHTHIHTHTYTHTRTHKFIDLYMRNGRDCSILCSIL